MPNYGMWMSESVSAQLPEKCEFDLSEVNNQAGWDIIC